MVYVIHTSPLRVTSNTRQVKPVHLFPTINRGMHSQEQKAMHTVYIYGIYTPSTVENST